MFKLLSDLLLLFKFIDKSHERRHREADEEGGNYPTVIKEQSITERFDSINYRSDH